MSHPSPFKWRHFESEIILLCVCWYLRYALSYRDLEEMMAERGLSVDHTTIYRWVQCYAPELAKRFFVKALHAPACSAPQAPLVEKQVTQSTAPADFTAIAELKAAGRLPESVELRQVKYLNNLVEQDHRFIKRLVKPGMGFFSVETAGRTLQGYEAMNMIRKGQVRGVGKGDINGQVSFIVSLFGVAA